MCRESQDNDKEGEADQAGYILSREMGREDQGMLRLHLCFPLLPPHVCMGSADKGTWSSRKVPQENSPVGSEWVKNKRQKRDQPWVSPGRCLFSCSGAGQGVLTFDFMLGLLSPPLKLFAVVVEPLEAHDAILEAGAATRGDKKGHKGSPSLPGHVDTPLCMLPTGPKEASGQGWVRTQPKAGKWGMSLPSLAIPHSISLSLFQLPESAQIQTILILGGWRGKGEPVHGGCSRLKCSPLEVTLAGPWVRVGSGNPMAELDPGLESWLGWHKPSPTGLLADSSRAPGRMSLKFCPWFASQPGEGLVLCNSAAGSEVKENFCP